MKKIFYLLLIFLIAPYFCFSMENNTRFISKLADKIYKNPMCISDLYIKYDLNSKDQTKLFYQLWKKDPASSQLANIIGSLNKKFGFKIEGKDNINLILNNVIPNYFKETNDNKSKNRFDIIIACVNIGANPFALLCKSLKDSYKKKFESLVPNMPLAFYPERIFHFYFNVLSAGCCSVDMKIVKLEPNEKIELNKNIKRLKKKVIILNYLSLLYREKAEAFFDKIIDIPIDGLNKKHKGVLGNMQQFACNLKENLNSSFQYIYFIAQ